MSVVSAQQVTGTRPAAPSDLTPIVRPSVSSAHENHKDVSISAGRERSLVLIMSVNIIHVVLSKGFVQNFHFFIFELTIRTIHEHRK